MRLDNSAETVREEVHYLVDTENMGKEWTELLCSEKNAVYHIFYTEKSPSVPIEAVERMNVLKKQLRFIKCHVGANALDFQLVTQLGYMLASAPSAQYHIVSKDTGYDAVVKIWTDRGMKVCRVGRLNAADLADTWETGDFENRCRDALREIATKDEAGEVANIIRKSATSGSPDYKIAIHTELVKEFSQARGSLIYNACKSIAERAYFVLNPC